MLQKSGNCNSWKQELVVLSNVKEELKNFSIFQQELVPDLMLGCLI
jgi:hypothetical protein